jgi:aryl-alcohol dehydrogenase-like predicted oxidoreductase
MRYRTFGRTGWQVSEIGFGAWQIGGDWGAVDDDASVATLLHAFERGVNFVDTAQLYGLGHSEEVVGRALREWRSDKVYVATKIQPVRWPQPSEADPEMRGRYPGWHLREGADEALRRLGVERIDLMQLHCWVEDGLTTLDWLEVLDDLRNAGKIDRIGVSIRDYQPQEGVRLAKYGLVESIQVIYNMFEQRPADELFPAGRASGTAMIARVPLDSGSLSGAWTPDSYSRWEPGSQPHTMFRGERFAETLARVEELKAICAPYYPTLAEAATRFALADPGVSVIIPGMTSLRRVDENAGYSDGQPFPPELKAALAAHGWVRDYYH